MKKIMILGSVSFKLDNAKVGINWIAEYFAKHGYSVTYVSSSSTILDLFSSRRRKRFIAAWLNGGRFRISQNLEEVVFKSLWLLNRLSNGFKHKTAGMLQLPIINDHYDMLISTVGALSLFADKINAQHKILRLQDHPHDFGMSSYVVNNFERLLSSRYFDQIWSVSKALHRYAAQFYSKDNLYLPNGVNLLGFSEVNNITNAKNVVYVGVFSDWVDLKLIYDTAMLLRDWQFDLYGHNLHESLPMPENVAYYGPVENIKIPEILPNYSIGLIPFKNSPHIQVVERPLKFSQYLAAGLGVASVDYGGLRQGMGDWVCYGNTAEEFSIAIKQAYIQRQSRSKEDVMDYLKNYDWSIILAQMYDLVDKINIKHSSSVLGN